jgi:hypothetical protein
MARRQHHNSISLFPFLAVLVCAMGALILLLLVMTRRIRHEQQLEQIVVVASDATLAVVPDRTAEIDDLELRIREAHKTVTAKQSQAEALQNIVEERRNRVQSLQKELDELNQRKIKEESGTFQASVAERMNDTRQLSAKEAALLRQLRESEQQLLEKQNLLAKATEATKDAQLILQKKNSALISLRRQVQDAQQKQSQVTGTETLLEFTNPTGTTRTPIVVDVSDRGFEILPNGIVITAADMEGFPVRDNPLLSAILTTHRHRARNSLTDQPYVLLLVRPDGCLAFYGAQRVLAEAGIHYGYELLEPDRQIVVGEMDPSEIPVVRASMEEAFRRRENLYAKLMALAQQTQGAPGSDGTPRTGSSERRMSVRPDGRVVLDENPGRRQLDGRYYAGGVAPPASLRQNRPAGGYRGLNPDRLTADDAEKLADEFAKRYAAQKAEARSAATATAGNSTPSGDPGTSDPIRSSGEQRFADVLFGGDESQPKSSGKSGESQQGSGSADRSLPDEALAGTAAPDSFAAMKADKPAASSEDSDWLQSSLLSGGTGSTSSTVSPPNKSKAGTPAESLLFAGDPSESRSTGMPDLSRIDPDLLRSLPSGKQLSSSLSTPVGIVVFLDEHHMTIGQQPAITVSQESLDAAFATLLQGIHTEVEDVRRKPGEPMMPIVKFIVSPGGEKWRIPLAHSLKRMGIHTVTMFELTPYITSTDRTGRARIDDQ